MLELAHSSHHRAEPHKQGICPCSSCRRQLREAPTSARACRACCPRAGATFQLSTPCALVTAGPAAEQGGSQVSPAGRAAWCTSLLQTILKATARVPTAQQHRQAHFHHRDTAVKSSAVCTCLSFQPEEKHSFFTPVFKSS